MTSMYENWCIWIKIAVQPAKTLHFFLLLHDYIRLVLLLQKTSMLCGVEGKVKKKKRRFKTPLRRDGQKAWRQKLFASCEKWHSLKNILYNALGKGGNDSVNNRHEVSWNDRTIIEALMYIYIYKLSIIYNPYTCIQSNVYWSRIKRYQIIYR